MKYLSILLLLLFITSAFAGSTQTNTSGSNTAIEGGYTSTATTTYQSGSESTSTTNNTTNSDIRSSEIQKKYDRLKPKKFFGAGGVSHYSCSS